MRIVYFSLLFFSIALHAWSDADVSSVTIQESQSRYSSTLAAPSVDKAWVESHYDKQEVMIPMRDGTRLFTAIYTPKQSDGKSPMLFKRTPYECAYGASWESALWRGWHKYAEDNYIFVFQDVRGKGKSEGVYVNIRPLASFIHGGKSFDEEANEEGGGLDMSSLFTIDEQAIASAFSFDTDALGLNSLDFSDISLPDVDMSELNNIDVPQLTHLSGSTKGFALRNTAGSPSMRFGL